jgi:hypothetical protein
MAARRVERKRHQKQIPATSMANVIIDAAGMADAQSPIWHSGAKTILTLLIATLHGMKRPGHLNLANLLVRRAIAAQCGLRLQTQRYARSSVRGFCRPSLFACLTVATGISFRSGNPGS